MRLHGRRDGNQAEIINALRHAGCSVLDLASVGAGCPDILCGRGHNTNRLIEIKDGKGKLTRPQAAFCNRWKGEPVVVVRTIEEAFIVMGITK